MAKKQTRRSISLNRILFEHAKQVAVERNISLSGLLEKCLAQDTGFDMEQLAEWRKQRAREAVPGTARPRTKEQIERQDMILSHIASKAFTYDEIGKIFGVTRQRVQQIAQRNGYTRSYKQRAERVDAK